MSFSAQSPNKVKIIFTLKEKVGALADGLGVFRDLGVNLTHIESRPSKRTPGSFEFLVEFCEGIKDTNDVISKINEVADVVIVHSFEPSVHDGAVPSFPTNIRQLDEYANRIYSYGFELDADHPGFTDPVYLERRKFFADIASKYRQGEPIPRVSYTEEEINTWRTIYQSLTELYPTHACAEFNHGFPLLRQNCNYNENTIPQFQDVSEFLKGCTGFTLRPVAGMLSPRDFIGALAFRVFPSSQFIRHASLPMYTPEPDLCHELLGHVPLFTDPDFAEFSQEVGLASLGAPDEWITKLTALYWYTAEFGICEQNGQKKAFGAGLLSSYGELKYCLTDEPNFRSFEPEITSEQEYPITKFQPTYYVASSFHDAKEKVRRWARQIPRKFDVRYNPYTQCVEILDNE